ncbi:phage portal protein [Luteimicrobium sp. NPDC057192]|uniref:phage portal protein n=1 Tax=Luteimicrobium sp. NPDC057192 TaxID=3346042 RepID=UPI00363172A5
MGFIQRLGAAVGLVRATTDDGSGPADGVVPPSRAASGIITPATALTISSVYRAIQIHAIAASQLSIDVERGGVIIDTPTLIAQPDIDESRSAFIERSVVALATTGNAFWIQRLGSFGQVVNLEPVDPFKVTVVELQDGSVEYHYDGRIYRKTGPLRMSHLQLLRVPGKVAGLGPIQAAQVELAGIKDVRDYASDWFQPGGAGVPNGVLSTDQMLTGTQGAQYKQMWNDTADGGVRVLGAGLTYSPILLKPADAQWLESQQFNVTQVARLFGVPASLMLAVIEGNSQSYSNVEQDWLAYVRFSLMGYLREIEEALTVLLPRGQSARFNVETLLRTDTKTRYESYTLAINAGWMRRSEVRATEHLDPIEGIDDAPVSSSPVPAGTGA